ncbi:hypothetical protein GGI35DRAFT_466927 [Trichoderma velutinum]
MSNRITKASHACKRCHARKRKCDRKHPKCSACAAADVLCELDMKNGDQELVKQVNDLRARYGALERRARWLEQALATGVTDTDPVSNELLYNQCELGEAPVTGTPQRGTPGIQFASYTVPSSTEDVLTRTDNSTLLPLLFIAPRTVETSSWSSISDIPGAPSLDSAIAESKTFLGSHKQTNNIVDGEVLISELHTIFEPGALADPHLDRARFRCFMVLYLAQEWYTQGLREEARGDLSKCQLYRKLALKDVATVIAREDLECVQALGLLALMSIQEPDGPDLWQVVGLAARTATAISIHRKDEVYLPLMAPFFPDRDALTRHNALRKNVFWAIYSLDRLTMFTLSRPAAMRDHDIDIELPSTPLDTSGVMRGMPRVALRVHSLKGRKLYGQIQESLYAVSITPDAPFDEREATVNLFVQKVNDWHSSSPLRDAFIPLSSATVKRQSLDDLQYHQMIMALHRPSPLIPTIPSHFITVLYDAACISVDLYCHYSDENQILVNWVHLKQIFTSCTTLLYCFWEHHTREDLLDISIQQVLERIDQSKRLLARFGPPWPQTQRYQAMFDNLAQPFLQQKEQQHHEQQGQQQNHTFLGTDDELSNLTSQSQTANSVDKEGLSDVFRSANEGYIPFESFEITYNDLLLPTHSPGSVMRQFWAETWTMPDSNSPH